MDKSSLWKTREFLAGSGAAAFAMVFLLLTLIQPITLENTYAINENSVEISSINSSLENIDGSLDTLNGNFDTLDQKIDKIGLILCDMSDGTHC